VGSDYARRQAAEDRWRQALDEHRRDPRAHPAARDDLLERTVGPRLREIDQLREEVNDLQQVHSEIKGGLTVLKWLVAGLGVLVTAFGSVVLVKIWG
jgi:hypothetical protein